MANDDGDAPPCDYISELPDNILVSILSLLPLDDAARSTALSTRWRHLFPSTLLDFRAFAPGRDVVTAVNTILAARVRSFHTSWLYFPNEDDPSVGGWLQDLAGRRVQELSLSFSEGWQRIPESLFSCNSLKRLHADCCTFPDATQVAAPLPGLTEIDLFGVNISQESLNALLSECTALEHLRMRSIGDCDCIHVRSASLKTLCVSGDFDELFIEDAPNLEQVYGNSMYTRNPHLKIAHAPKLEFLGYLGMSFGMIKIGQTVFTENDFGVKTLMPSLKTVAVELSYTSEGYIDWFMQLLKLFPCLETLYIRSDTWSKVQAAAPGSWDVLRSVPCIDNHLDKVVFEVYRGHEWQREMAKFLHGRGRFLNTMEFHCMGDKGCSEHLGDEWVREQQELLCLDSRASMDARFLFFEGPLVGD
ncbi:F-box/FBD/LRR-repeat protein At1g13570-like isoform X2 [Oryza brachyantha]|uniref:F-box/FBD/LRR-repeat protein At1g13570-like isoform X2 n=1 Tax=Oryza brachyantha TaxID=4533 RepID=UPI001AD9BC2B|nr:F-box/FBD/LRR-repeat protein At1g13570-like isoform X2 [Oryza brachyantha]